MSKGGNSELLAKGVLGGLRSLAGYFGAEIKEGDFKENQIAPQEKLTRQSLQEVINEQKNLIREGLQEYLPRINSALEKKWNRAAPE